ncbi:MAG TPA: hypothetical protein VI968_02500 [archaeon]|nr:hypothetical protein [archaeon]
MNTRTLVWVDNEDSLPHRINALAESRGYNFHRFYSAREAIEAIEIGLKYLALFTDLSFPRERYSGEDVMQKSKEVNPKVPVVCVTGYSVVDSQFANICITKTERETLRRYVDTLTRNP